MSELPTTKLTPSPLPYASASGEKLAVYVTDSAGNFYGITTNTMPASVVLFCARQETTHAATLDEINASQFSASQNDIRALLKNPSVADDILYAIHRIRSSKGTRILPRVSDIQNALPHALCQRLTKDETSMIAYPHAR